MTIRHVVSWKLAAEGAEERAAHAAEIARRLNALDGVVPGLLSISVGANTLYADANWDVALVADFPSVAELEAYQVHPAHTEVTGYVRSVVASRVAVDFEV
ncbi:Dabb family protein [Microbacterium sp. H83]|uniref:Dabb family protein n=1 Tax=Microbacterium sp. H83 TaxID=1827324 RepID=UPI0007F4038E|nr:Dabb family protein [Microbacterium sp. H83]OAN35259.1 stress responsive alpha-beta barrel domain-containing protein [Microbacterium sp. H83]